MDTARPVDYVARKVGAVTLDEIKRAAEAQANEDCERGLADLDRKIETAPEYEISGNATGRRLIVATKATLIGMRDHLAASISAQRWCDRMRDGS